jgi:iron complex outermembrane receptor protein
MKISQLKFCGRGSTLVLVAALAVTKGFAEDGVTNQSVLAEMPIEKLMEIEVTSVSKRAEKLAESAAAVSVLTQDDIQRSGARSIPEALRLVPGLDVAQVDSQQWAISARGFNDVFANKLLVLQDGRSVYTPLFSGVFWDVQNTLMEDIDRIEVIRGPGASLWGANAVDGVINIMTKSTKETQGFLATAGGGTYEQGFAGVRYGGKIGDDAYFRIYGQYFHRGDSASPNASDVEDSWQMGQGGFRVDWEASPQNLFTLQGDLYGGWLNQQIGMFDPTSPTLSSTANGTSQVSGGNVLGRWTHNFSDDSDLKVQAYYDRTYRNSAIFNEGLNTYDLDVEHHFALGEKHRNDFTWGLGYRVMDDLSGGGSTVSFSPAQKTTQLFSAFAQDEIALVEHRLHLTLGAKFEHNDYTGFEVQPNVRLAWTPSERQTVWAAISRAVRTPSRAEEAIKLNQQIAPGAVATIYGNENFVSEELLAYELGYRIQPMNKVSVDLALYYNDYTHLRSQEFGPSPTQPPTAPPPLGAQFPVNVENHLHGYTYGLEVAPKWQVTDWWRLQPAYTLLKMHLSEDSDSTDTTSVRLIEGESPQQQFSLRSSMDFPHDISFDCTLRYVDRLPSLHVGSYVALDARLAWRATKNLEFELVGQNLGPVRHAEFNPTFIATPSAEVRESVYAKVTWRF